MFEKTIGILFSLYEFPVASHIIREEHGIHYMPCSSRIISEMTTESCYHSDQGINNCCA